MSPWFCLWLTVDVYIGIYIWIDSTFISFHCQLISFGFEIEFLYSFRDGKIKAINTQASNGDDICTTYSSFVNILKDWAFLGERFAPHYDSQV